MAWITAELFAEDEATARKAPAKIPGRFRGTASLPCGKVWPNGEFSYGYAPAGGRQPVERLVPESGEAWASLGSSVPTNSHRFESEPRKPRGTGGLTSYGKKMIRCGAEFLQRRHGKGRIAFATLTLPSCTPEESWNVSTNWSQIVRVFFQRLGRFLGSRNLPTQYVACSEVQPKRGAREKHPALHLHFLVVTKRRGEKGWAITPSELRGHWKAVVSPYLSSKKDWSACEQLVAMKKDAGKYMSKYLSKGAKGLSEMPDPPDWANLPTSWYSLSMGIRRWVKDNTRSCPVLVWALERAVVGGLSENDFHYLARFRIEKDNCIVGAGAVGRLKGAALHELIAFSRDLIASGGGLSGLDTITVH